MSVRATRHWWDGPRLRQWKYMSACGDYTMPFAFFPCVDRYGRQLEDWPTCSDRKFLYETTTKRRKVDLRVEASAPVEVYIVQESDLDNWKAGDSYEGWSFPTAKATCAQLIFPRRRAAGNEIQAEAENAEDSNGWAATRRRSGCNSESEGEIVPTTTLNPGKFRKFLYETTTKRRKVDLRVEASAPVEVYIVQESDLDNWKAGDSYEGWSFPTAKATRAQLIFPAAFEKDWYLVLRNPGDKVAGVHYELFDV